VQDWWTAVLEGVEAFREVLADPDSVPQLRKEHPEWALLLKPAMHIVLFKALIKAVGRGVPREEAIARLNKIDWTTNAPLWRNILITGADRIVARAENYDITAEVIAYLIGGDGSLSVRNELEKRGAAFVGEDEYNLPKAID